MKKLTLLFVFATIVFAVNAQSPLNVGLKAGYSSSKVKIKKDVFDESKINNYIFGAWGRINIKSMHIQPEAYFTQKGGKLKAVDSKIDLSTIDIPVLLGCKIINLGAINFRLHTGPVFSLVTKKDVHKTDFKKDDIKDSFVGIQYGGGVDLLFLTLDMRWENSLGNIVKNAQLGNGKSKAFLVTLGFKIL